MKILSGSDDKVAKPIKLEKCCPACQSEKHLAVFSSLTVQDIEVFTLVFEDKAELDRARPLKGQMEFAPGENSFVGVMCKRCGWACVSSAWEKALSTFTHSEKEKKKKHTPHDIYDTKVKTKTPKRERQFHVGDF